MNKLRDLRISKGFSQLEVAAKIGKNDLFISKIETNKIEMKLNEAAHLAYVYEVSLDDIYVASKSKSEKFNKV
ncbi:helix-turn-helix transcriptional regulator [Clostridium faecium]|uniref:helix-turn-helix transcriptional regulator n=1 Tax=Clostridium faecium TaxID=2762223 RepID=UPI0028BE52DF|nr:helix-turn-helix transcriptional regulator [Clostridium faecium]